MRGRSFRICRRRTNERKGAVVVFLAVILVLIIGVVAFCVDLGYLSSVKAQLNAAADASALAGAGAMAQSFSQADVEEVALAYASSNVPENYGNVADDSSITFGIWQPETKTFVPDSVAPNALRVVLARTSARGNAVSLFFGRIFGTSYQDLVVESVAVGSVPNVLDMTSSVYVTSTKDLSNVVLEFSDGMHQKFEGLHGYSGTFIGTGEHASKEIVGVWIKSGCNSSTDGPGYGERLLDPQDGSTVHGQPGGGCTPHVTATFESTGVTFTQSGSYSPVRLVK